MIVSLLLFVVVLGCFYRLFLGDCVILVLIGLEMFVNKIFWF